MAETNIDGFTSSVARCTEEAQTHADTPNFHIDCFFIMRKQNKKSSFDLGGLSRKPTCVTVWWRRLAFSRRTGHRYARKSDRQRTAPHCFVSNLTGMTIREAGQRFSGLKCPYGPLIGSASGRREIRESGRERESVDVPWKKDYKMYDSSAQADGATKKKTNEKQQHEDYIGPLRPTFYITPHCVHASDSF